MLRTIDGIATDTADALETAENIKQSVKLYRKKVSRLKGRVEDDMDGLADRMEDVERERQSMTTTLSLIRGESATEEDLNALEDRVEATDARVAETETRLELENKIR